MSSVKNAAESIKIHKPEDEAGPSLHVIEGSKNNVRRGATSILFLVAIIFMLAIIVPLVANTSMAQLAYNVRDLRVTLNEENAAIDSLEKQLMEVSSADGLAEKAKEVGLVPAGPIGVISLEKGTVEGGYAAQ